MLTYTNGSWLGNVSSGAAEPDMMVPIIDRAKPAQQQYRWDEAMALVKFLKDTQTINDCTGLTFEAATNTLEVGKTTGQKSIAAIKKQLDVTDYSQWEVRKATGTYRYCIRTYRRRCLTPIQELHELIQKSKKELQ